MDTNSRLHSPEFLRQRLATFQSLKGAAINPDVADACREFFTKPTWKTADRRFMLILDHMVFRELETGQGREFSRVSKVDVQTWYSHRFYTDVFLKRIKPVIRGHHESKMANQYAGSNYLAAGFRFIDELSDLEHAAACRRRVLEVTPYFYDVFYQAKMIPSAMENDTFCFEPSKMIPSAIQNDTPFKIDSSGSVGSGSTSADASATLTASPAGEATVPTESAKLMCAYCKQRYKKEAAFAAHTCDARTRFEFMQSPAGQRVLDVFNLGQRKQRRKPISAEAFRSMRTAKSWIEFVEWADRTGIADLGLYIELALALKVSVQTWRHTDLFNAYRLQLIARAPMLQVDTSVESIKAWAQAATCKTADVFDAHDFGSIYAQLQSGLLSPFLLMNSRKFRDLFGSFTEEQKAILRDEMKPICDRFPQHGAELKYARQQAEALGV